MTTIAWITSLVVAIYLGRWIENRKTSAYWTQWHANQIERFINGQRDARDAFEQSITEIKQAWLQTTKHAYNAGIKEAKEKEQA
jgi:hypothetical protein